MTEHQKGADGTQPVAAAQPDQQTAEQQKLAAGPAAGAVAVEPPEEEKYTVHVPEGLTYFDLDLIKLTAQFVARNGKGFLTGAASFSSCVTAEHQLPSAETHFSSAGHAVSAVALLWRLLNIDNLTSHSLQTQVRC